MKNNALHIQFHHSYEKLHFLQSNLSASNLLIFFSKPLLITWLFFLFSFLALYISFPFLCLISKSPYNHTYCINLSPLPWIPYHDISILNLDSEGEAKMALVWEFYLPLRYSSLEFVYFFLLSPFPPISYLPFPWILYL